MSRAGELASVEELLRARGLEFVRARSRLPSRPQLSPSAGFLSCAAGAFLLAKGGAAASFLLAVAGDIILLPDASRFLAHGSLRRGGVPPRLSSLGGFRMRPPGGPSPRPRLRGPHGNRDGRPLGRGMGAARDGRGTAEPGRRLGGPSLLPDGCFVPSVFACVFGRPRGSQILPRPVSRPRFPRDRDLPRIRPGGGRIIRNQPAGGPLLPLPGGPRAPLAGPGGGKTARRPLRAGLYDPGQVDGP